MAFMDMNEIRINNLLDLVQKYGTQKKLSLAACVDSTRISNMINRRRSIGEKTARLIEESLDLTPGWMDIDHSESKNPILDEARRKLGQVDDDLLPVVLGAIEAAIKKGQ